MLKSGHQLSKLDVKGPLIHNCNFPDSAAQFILPDSIKLYASESLFFELRGRGVRPDIWSIFGPILSQLCKIT